MSEEPYKLYKVEGGVPSVLAVNRQDLPTAVGGAEETLKTAVKRPKPFEQQPRESNKAFAAFSIYLNLGSERSLAMVGEKLGKCEALIERWSTKFGWTERIRAYGEHMALVERQAVEVMARAKAVDWARRREELLETEWSMHEKCIAAATKAFATFMEKEKVYANLADIARILEVASKMGRLAAGLATDRTEVSGDLDVKVDLEFEAALKKVYGPVVDVGEDGKGQMADGKGGAA